MPWDSAGKTERKMPQQRETCSESTSSTRHGGTQVPKRLHRCPGDQTALRAAGQKRRGSQASDHPCPWRYVLLGWFPHTAAAWTSLAKNTGEVAHQDSRMGKESKPGWGGEGSFSRWCSLWEFWEVRLPHPQPPCSPSRYWSNCPTPYITSGFLKLFLHQLK